MAVSSANATKAVIRTQQGWRRLIKPYLFSTLAIGTSVTLGDFICQYLERHKHRKEDVIPRTSLSSALPWWNSERSLIMCTSAVVVSTPWNFTIQRTVERLFPGKQSKQIAKKMLTNILLAPIGISLMFTTITLLKGQSIGEAKIKVKTDMPKTFLTGSCYWPFVSFINFRFVPLDYRPFLGSLAGAIWNIYISSVANTTADIEQPSEITLTNLISETGGTTIPTLEKAWNILDQNKKDL
ncbi:unnamed protein product [Adineta steineri]|uniref:Uncharacterized protein n=1 Tax=Adineta steineri TaxID=433720 RepID=A0A813VP98_9BILA|nr:unnamed protein product [Adineta steineri]CAF1472463.1 unnamed protein product [Adineta steineri]CAF4017213.1 unnamed protein product [Adineta steineri]